MYKAILCSVVFVASISASHAITLATDFPGGSAEVRLVDAATGRIEISPSHHDGRGWPCWWYFRVEGAQLGQQLTLVVGPNQKPFRAEQRLAASWSLPDRAAISVDDVNWTQTEPGTIGKESGSYSITAPAERFWLAWGPPFVPADAEHLLDRAIASTPGAEKFLLAQTRGGRPVNGLRLGKRDAGQVVWVQARQHAWESGGSWVGVGFLDWVTSDAATARDLREKAEIFFIPIMDVDNVALGAGGKESAPRDHNRDWAAEPLYPEVAAAQEQLKRHLEAGRLRVFLDLHNPSPGDKKPYFFGPFDYETMTGPRRQTYDRFLELAVETMTGPLAIHPSYRFATYVKTEEERDRMSGAWIRNRSDDRVIAMTLETAWNTPHSTQQGYRKVGQQLAHTVAKFLNEP